MCLLYYSLPLLRALTIFFFAAYRFKHLLCARVISAGRQIMQKQTHTQTYVGYAKYVNMYVYTCAYGFLFSYTPEVEYVQYSLKIWQRRMLLIVSRCYKTLTNMLIQGNL